MIHALENMSENMHALLEHMLDQFARSLRKEYPGHKISRATVYASAIPEFERLGIIELVDVRVGVSEHVPDQLVARIKRSRQPIWIPGRNFPDRCMDLFDQMEPFLNGDEIAWKHTPSKRGVTSRKRIAN